METQRSRCYVGLVVMLAAVVVVFCPKVWALTAQEIADSVIDELNNVSDYTATVDIDYDDAETRDMSGGSVQWKRSSGYGKAKVVLGSPYSGEVRTDGTTGFNIWDKNGDLVYIPLSNGMEWVRANWGTDMFNMETILDAETWTKDANTHTINSVTCYRIYTSDYEVYIDEGTVKKVIRVKAYDTSSNIDYQLDYSDYSNVENTAQLPGTIEVKSYNDQAGLVLTTTYTVSDVNINEGLSDSLFSIKSPRY